MLILTSGCTQTGKIVGDGNLTQEEMLILEEFLNRTPEIRNETNMTENISPPVYRGHTEPQNITQPLGCPETCDDGDYCTYDYCSQNTGYECAHAERICPNTVRQCPDGTEVICENVCAGDSCTTCEPDCGEHQLPSCGLTQEDCGQCRILNTGDCECALIVSCVNSDGCCPGGCNYANDDDCEVPPGECSGDSECDDNNSCTLDTCDGIPKACWHEEITACAPGDGCCPSGCNHTSDTDCEGPEEPEWGNHSDIIINEIMYDPSTEQCSDYDCEWIELYNKGDYRVNLSGWTLDGNPFDAGIIRAGEYIVIARELTDGDDADIESFEYFWGDNSTAWGDSETENYSAFDGSIGLTNSGGDTVILQSPSAYYDSVTYSDDRGADGNNKTLERYENGTWGEGITDGGTPGSENSIF